jgi:glycosyltransferase involved in cell wall biosynthesis
LHVIGSMGVDAGGPPAICAGIAEASAAAGNTLTIATVETSGPQVPVQPAVTLQCFPKSRQGKYGASQALSNWLEGHINAFDIVHIHSVWEFSTWIAARNCRRAGVPYVILLNGMLEQYSVENRSYWLKRTYWAARGRPVFAHAAGLHCGNRAEIRRAVPWIANFPKFIVGNGVSKAQVADLPAPGAFRAAHGEVGNRPFALFLSRIHPKKGLDRLIPHWKSVHEKMPEARLVIAGGGDPDYVKMIDALIAQHDSAGSIIRVGQLTGRKKWEALVDADLFVLPSLQEGFSMAITEALGVGKPVVVTEECNFDEVEDPVAGPCGVIVKGGDMTAFAAAVEKLLTDPDLRACMGANGAALVSSRFTWERIASDLEQVYRHILAGKPLMPDGSDVWREAALRETAS